MTIRGRGTPDDPTVSVPAEVLDVACETGIDDGADRIVVYLEQPFTGETWTVSFTLPEWDRLAELGGAARASAEE